MSEQKKPKIDLKARLGKKTVAGPSGGPSIPPPVGIPKPPPMAGLGGGTPSTAPPAAVAAQPAPPAAPPPKAQAIRVEMDEEVVQAQKKGKSRILVAAGAAGAVAMIIGFAFGSGYQRGQGAEVALQGADMLVDEVDKANLTAQKLSDVLKQAAEKLGEGKFPEEQIKELGGINIPFEGVNLVGKGIGRFKPQLVTMLISYASRAQEANDQKESIARLLSGSRSAVEELLAQKETPKIRWSVFVLPGPHGPWANMQPVPKPFLVKSDKKVKDKDGKEKAYNWPEEFEIKDGKETVKLERYTSGEPTGEKPKIIPVAPQTESLVCPDSTMVRIRKELAGMQQILEGVDTPGHEKQGLVDLGDAVLEELKKIGGPG